jgi:hypothetical protein
MQGGAQMTSPPGANTSTIPRPRFALCVAPRRQVRRGATARRPPALPTLAGDDGADERGQPKVRTAYLVQTRSRYGAAKGVDAPDEHALAAELVLHAEHLG